MPILFLQIFLRKAIIEKLNFVIEEFDDMNFRNFRNNSKSGVGLYIYFFTPLNPIINNRISLSDKI